MTHARALLRRPTLRLLEAVVVAAFILTGILAVANVALWLVTVLAV